MRKETKEFWIGFTDPDSDSWKWYMALQDYTISNLCKLALGLI